MSGVIPRISVGDTAVITLLAEGVIRAAGRGSTWLRASEAGQQRVWHVSVDAPQLRLRLRTRTLVLGDTVPIVGEYVRRDGKSPGHVQHLHLASLTPAILQANTNSVQARAIGRGILRYSDGVDEDTVAFYALGDLVGSVQTTHGPRLATVSLRNGKAVRIGPADTPAWSPMLAPDGSRIAFVSNRTGRPRIFVCDLDGSNVRRLTPERTGMLGLHLYQQHSPTWSADGNRVFYVSSRNGAYEIYSVAVEGEDLRQITHGRGVYRQLQTARTEPRLAYQIGRSREAGSIYVTLADGSDPRRVRLDSLSTVRAPRFAGPHRLFVIRDNRASGESLVEVR